MKKNVERTMTLHPAREKGVNIETEKYDWFRAAIVARLQRGELTYTDLAESIRDELGGSFKGSVTWYVETLKQDLQARSIIERVPQTRPQRYRLR